MKDAFFVFVDWSITEPLLVLIGVLQVKSAFLTEYQLFLVCGFFFTNGLPSFFAFEKFMKLF